jgi:hypothetical protein
VVIIAEIEVQQQEEPQGKVLKRKKEKQEN